MSALVYRSVNAAVRSRVPPDARRILDVGCGGGDLGAAIKTDRNCAVVGVTFNDREAERARSRLDRVEVADLNQFDPTSLGIFDCIICSHVLEHLIAPEQLLTRLGNCLAPSGVLLVALPNALFWKQRLEFMRGRFRYTEGGLMDRTHYRFYDWETALQLLSDCGYQVYERCAEGAVPLARLLWQPMRERLERAALRSFPGMFGVQFVLSCLSVKAG